MIGSSQNSERDARLLAAHFLVRALQSRLTTPFFPALRSNPMALSGVSSRKQVPSSNVMTRFFFPPPPMNPSANIRTTLAIVVSRFLEACAQSVKNVSDQVLPAPGYHSAPSYE
jgi:hypothetical protein